MTQELPNPSESEQLAEACLAYLIADPEELARFMDFSGMGPDDLRSAIGGQAFVHGVIDYFAQNESALMAMSANSGIDIERFMRQWHRLNPGH